MPKFESPLELDFRIHYARMDEKSGPWEGVRVRRLCALLRISTAELACFIRVPKSYLIDRMTKQKLPGSIRLLLNIIESAARKKYLGREPEFSILPEI